MQNSFGQAAKDLVNISNLPAGTALGTFGQLAGKSGDTLLSGLQAAIARKLTTTDQREFGQFVAALDANMSRILGGGYASSTARGLVESYNSQVAKEGDSPAVQAMFLARFKQELDTFAENYKTYPGSKPEMIQAVQKQNEEIKEAIPWTVEQVIAATNKSGSKVTISRKFSDALNARPNNAPDDTPRFENEAEAQAAADRGEIAHNQNIIIGGVAGKWNN